MSSLMASANISFTAFSSFTISGGMRECASRAGCAFVVIHSSNIKFLSFNGLVVFEEFDLIMGGEAFLLICDGSSWRDRTLAVLRCQVGNIVVVIAYSVNLRGSRVLVFVSQSSGSGESGWVFDPTDAGSKQTSMLEDMLPHRDRLVIIC